MNDASTKDLAYEIRDALDRLTLEVRRLRQVQAMALIKGTGVKAKELGALLTIIPRAWGGTEDETP